MQKSKFQKDDTFLMQTGNILAFGGQKYFFPHWLQFSVQEAGNYSEFLRGSAFIFKCNNVIWKEVVYLAVVMF